MFVKHKILIESITGNTIQLPITISQSNDMVGQSDLIDNDFVKVEREKAINDIVDYEKIRFLPANDLNSKLKDVIYTISFYSGTSHSLVTWEDIGFTQEDLVFKRNKFKKSFLRLTFYDSTNLLGQNAIFFITLFPFLDPNSQPSVTNPIEFIRQNPVTNPNGFAEGFYIYFYKDLVSIGEDFDLYMRAEFLNASSGVKTPLMMYNGVPPYDDTFKDKIHIKYIFRKTNENYLYIVDDSGGTVQYSSTGVRINLYESVVL